MNNGKVSARGSEVRVKRRVGGTTVSGTDATVSDRMQGLPTTHGFVTDDLSLHNRQVMGPEVRRSVSVADSELPIRLPINTLLSTGTSQHSMTHLTAINQLF
jgi:hypothetical protein